MLDWDPGGDFETVVDTLVPVILRRAGCEESLTTLGWRFAERTTSDTPGGGAVRIVESTWQLPIAGDPFYPEVGDRLIGPDSSCTTLHSIEHLRGGTRLRCLARRVLIDPAEAEWFDLEQAVWDPQQSTEEPIDWVRLRPALRGYASRLSVAEDEANPTIAVDQCRVVFAEPVEATTNDRFHSHAGQVFRVVSQDFDNRLGGGWSYRTVRTS